MLYKLWNATKPKPQDNEQDKKSKKAFTMKTKTRQLKYREF